MSNEEDILIFTDSGDIANATGFEPDWADYDLDNITFNIPEEQTIEGVNKRLDAIEARLNIRKPDPEMLEKYELLQNLYEQYKTAEALLKNSNTL